MLTVPPDRGARREQHERRAGSISIWLVATAIWVSLTWGSSAQFAEPGSRT